MLTYNDGFVGVVREHGSRPSGRRRYDGIPWRDAATYGVRHNRVPEEAALTVAAGKPGVKRRYSEQRVQRTVNVAAGRFSEAVETR